MESQLNAAMCVMAVTLSIAGAVVVRSQRLRPIAGSALVSGGAAIGLGLRLALHTPSSLDAIGDGFELLPFAFAMAVMSVFHAIMSLGLLGAMLGAVRSRPKTSPGDRTD